MAAIGPITVKIHSILIITTDPGCTTITTEVMGIVRVVVPTGPDPHIDRAPLTFQDKQENKGTASNLQS